MSGRTYDRVKRMLDTVASAAGLLATAPLQLGVALTVALRLGRPVLFRQLRPGRDGELFELVKFRTMTPIDPQRGLVTDADRLTPFGRRLRATSLDELPTLWNVLVGDMSFVGPRPLLPEYLSLYSPDQARRHDVRPGITGLAQVAGRNHVEWADRLALDIAYVSARSPSLDARILWQTLRVVLTREGIAGAGEATMAPFRGAAER
jgi:lipopolysaccharide/colanic/teichoic acid biosynthesis glycosyltransferase